MSQDYTTGQKLGDYEILGILGAGGMGKVYKVRNTISDRVEAMKILLPDLAGQKDLADRFLREIKLLASLSHPNIAALRTALTLDNQLVMIMEYVDGVTLSSRLQQGAIPPGQAVKYIDQVLDALSYAHKQNIIHRDIKPANMMLTPDGTVKLMDFGIARSASDRSLTMTGTTLGSLNYMPPEQVKGDPADNRSDLYSLGVSLYEMVTGQLPFQADSNYAMMAAHLQEAPKPPIVLRPGIPQPLNQIILMALAKDPGQRFQSADAFRAALKSVQAHGAGTQPAVDPRSYAPSSAADAGGATALFQETPASQSPTTVMDAPVFQQTQPLAAAVAPAGPPPPAVSSGGHRGLYIALGAFIVVAVLFAAGLYLPGHLKTLAGAGKNSLPPQQSQPADSSASAPASTTPSALVDSTATPSAATPNTPDTSSATSAAATGASSAASGAQSSQSGQSSPDASSASSTPASDATTSTPPAANSSTAGQPLKKPSSSKSRKNAQSASQSQDVVPSASSGSAAQASQEKAEAEARAEEVEQKFTEVDSRSTAATQSLDNLKRQQAASGYGLRSDIVSAEERMKADLNKAQYFMQKQDSKNAKKYLDMADAELQTIEKFLGH
ncbi:MAG TPA: serine/threonine-protein kinase [Candidatus Acidoferrum sp.]|nr:serine/threonine-protein kinase [Candidatus Acidoferrum sp.]